MARLTELPPEILLQIVHFVLADQDLKHDIGYTPSGEVEHIYHKTKDNSFIRGLDWLAEHEAQNGYPNFSLFWSMARHRLSKQALVSLSLTCRVFHNLVEATLFKTVELTQPNQGRDNMSLDRSSA